VSVARVVLDSNVWLDWLLFADPACAELEALSRAGRLQPVTRADCREEWQRVLAYPAFGLEAARQQALIAAHDARVLQLDGLPEAPGPLPRCRDHDDQKWLELARDAGAALLLTRDAELLRLAARMRRDHGVVVCRPAALADAWSSRHSCHGGPARATPSAAP
jgi:uncharacterized protein